MSSAPSGPESTSQASAPIAIVGGGFGGLYTALALAEQRQHPPLLLIEPRSEFLFLPLLYELLSGELRRWEIAPRYDTLLAGRGIAWLRDSVVEIDSRNRLLHTSSGRQLPYSQLVLATGARLQSFGIPGVTEHAIGFRSLADVERLQALVTQLCQRRHPLQRLAIVGAGPSGVELACKLADMLAGAAVVELIEQGPMALPQARAFNREQASRALQRRDVRLRCNCRVLEVGSDRIRLQGSAGEEHLTVAGVVWTAGLAFAPPAIQPPPLLDNSGRLAVNEHLQLVGQARIFALGDIAAPHGAGSSDGAGSSEGAGSGDAPCPWPATAQVAFQQATCLATNLIQARREGPLQPFHFNDLGEMLSLGRGEATLVGSGLTLAGAAAFQLRRLAYLTRLPGRSHQLRVAAGWLADW
ncbi:MAG: FAD-dependent oxidoreductase [Cyanobium sp. M30B3]|nr:MAG: FAD-dependent oxidoreductase [Cyanobium sp. M30B3]